MFEPWPDVAVHLEWGEIGAHEAANRGDTVIVVDIFSFSTTVTMIAERGGRVFALGRGEESPVDTFVLAKDRRDRDARVTLSPTSTARVQPGDRLALTSLNGAAVVAACRHASEVLIGCLRNRSALARAVDGSRRVTVIACAEKWSSLGIGHGVRPSLEDWLGAGAIIDALRATDRSPEAHAAAAAFAVATDLDGWLRHCVSARELVAKGFPDDVDLALAIDVTAAVPRLAPDGFFEATL